jgi:hypothetical protein
MNAIVVRSLFETRMSECRYTVRLRQVVMGLHLKEGGESGQLAIEP